jgi:hypothetical protein
MLIIELDKDRDPVDLDRLTAAQHCADRLPHAMSGYIAWLAPQMPALPETLAAAFTAARARAAAQGGEHLRIPATLAHLWIGLTVGLNYAVHVGACSEQEAAAIRDDAWRLGEDEGQMVLRGALIDAGHNQAQHVEAERPSHRFLRVLASLLAERRGVLLPKQADGDPRLPGDLLGWLDDEYLYLIPEASWQAVSRACRDAGEPFAVREERLRRDLATEGLINSVDGRHTASVWIGGVKRRVLRINRLAAQDVVDEEFAVWKGNPAPAGTTGTGGTGLGT